MSDRTYLEIQKLKFEIDQLVAQYPELEGDDQLRADVCEGETGLAAVLGRIVSIVREAEANAEAVKTMRDQMDKRIAAHKRRGEALRKLIQSLLDRVGAKSFKLPEATLSVRNTPRPVIITDEGKLQPQFIKTTTTPNKSAIKAVLEGGHHVDGAQLGNGGQSLTLRFV